jgi:ribulose-5-phosphate 4-epimerase/fuculose-1-phosphate aldolase
MSNLDLLLDELVTANRILAHEGIVDAYGHISVRHPDKPDRYFLSRARTPQCVERSDIMEFTMEGEPIDGRGLAPYFERFIHGGIFLARPEVKSIVHSHSAAVIPFGVGGEKIRPMMLNCALIGKATPIWDSRDKFGDTDLMVTSMAMGHDLARGLGANPTALMRGHGSVAAGKTIRQAVFIAIKLQESASFQREASRYKDVKFLSDGEIAKVQSMLDFADVEKPLRGIDRAWEYWCYRANQTFRPLS